ncbi:hypothetical protein BDQ17DRAFT_1369461 [Cyathus striatus]|nr:hypothetical protein BDQ17DRAFT_1369461 [Cyathus striatus]
MSIEATTEHNYPSSIVKDALHKRVEAVDPNGGRCLVENHSERQGVEYCHVMPRKLMYNDKLLDSLEWNWNMRKGTLNLDTRYNVFPAGESVFRMFDKNQWILLPDDEILEKYVRAFRPSVIGRTRRERFPNVNGDKFEYRLIPVVDMEDVTFTRQNDTTTLQHAEPFTVHKYPFNTFPKLISHIHPKFVIAAVGYLLLSNKPFIMPFFNQHPILRTIIKIYRLWTGRFPPDSIIDSTFFPEYYVLEGSCEETEEENASMKTERGRGYKRLTPPIDPTDIIERVSSYESEADSDSDNSVNRYIRKRVAFHRKQYRYKDSSRKSKKPKLKPSLPEGDTTMWNKDSLAEWARNVDSNSVVHSDESL